HLPDGSPFPASPRQVMQRVVARCEALGFTATMAGEYEFFLFKEDSHSVRAKGYRDLTPLSPGMFGYSALRASTYGNLLHELLEQLDGFGLEVEAVHTETGPGVYEAAIRYDGA